MARIPNLQRLALHEMGRPRFNDGGSRAVLMIHGWTGFPGMLYPLFDAIAEAGYTVDLPRLPGHGTAMRDMLSTGHRDWLRRACDAYLDLKASHEEVILLGHSMGGVIALIVAAQVEVARTVLLAPAVTNRNKLIVLARMLWPLLPRLRSSWSEEEEQVADLVELGREYFQYDYPRAASELWRMQQLCKRHLGRVSGRVLTVVSEADQLVAPSVADLISARSPRAQHTRVLLKESDHNLPGGSERETVAQLVLDWLAT